MEEYVNRQEVHSEKLTQLTKRYNRFSAIRLSVAIGILALLYSYSNNLDGVLFGIAMLLVVAFLLIVRMHQKITWNKRLEKELVSINENERAYLGSGQLPFEDGSEFIDTSHFYSYDLDLFGQHSLYQHLNRTGTYVGKKRLAEVLLHPDSAEKILLRQAAVKELTGEIAWRQKFLALAQINRDNSESVSDLMDWAKAENRPLAGFLRLFSFVSPVLTIASLAVYFTTPMGIFGNIGLLLILLNLSVMGTQYKRIMQEILTSTAIDKILKQYSFIIHEIESKEFVCEELKTLRKSLLSEGEKTSERIRHLSLLFHRLDHISNVFAAPILNGLFLFHMHTLHGLYKWKKASGKQVSQWLEVIGEFEALNSLANFSFNNPSYCFPELNNEYQISFEDAGHPLLRSDIRISNQVTFQPQRFFILTGSNMSGKSTFLRTLGINMVLASSGAPVCASKATFQPLPILVSMRLSDSLSDSESYFFAEVKRLKQIMDRLDSEACFVLLDEILRGTNSDDKRTGTMEVTRKMVKKNAIGAIATHDLEVCNVAAEFPEKLVNKCFEVEIVNDELVFDYLLRDGICKNKSATFLMEKMGVI